MTLRTSKRWGLVAIAAATVLTLAACAPGGTAAPAATDSSSTKVSKDVAKLGKITLTVWDQETTPGISDSLDTLNKEFEKKYPNVTVDRVVRSGTDLRTTLKLALTAKTPPDVIQANQGYADMGAYVKAGLLTDLGPYDKAYGWSKRIPASQLALDSVKADGSAIGSGNLYGVSITGEVVGVFYDKTMLDKLGLPVPASMDELKSDLPKIKAAGELPISFGDQDKSPIIHLWGLSLVPSLGQKATSDLVFGRGGKWTDSDVQESAQTLADWASKGYLTSGYDGINSNSAAQAFGAGTGAFFLGGVWNQDAIQKGLGDNAGFTVLPEKKGGKLAAMGGIGMGWSIPSKSNEKTASAAYIDFISNAHAMDVLQSNNQLPAVPSGKTQAGASALTDDVLKTWSSLNKSDGLVPYVDWTTSTFYDTITQNLQELMAGQEDASAYTKALQTDYAAFAASK